MLAALRIEAQQAVICQDSAGVIVEIKEKYGSLIVDTCTVVMFHEGQFVLVKRSGATGWFPSAFHSIRIIGRLAGDGR
jgi:hypothetical protein